MKTAGKFIYIIPLTLFGLMHFANAQQMASMVPSWLPGGVFWVYLTGLGLIAATVALLINKKVTLAMTLLGVELLSFALFIHIPTILGGDQMAVGQLLKDVALAGAAFYIAGVSQDAS